MGRSNKPMTATKIYIDVNTKRSLKELAAARNDTMSHTAELILCDYMRTYVAHVRIDPAGQARLNGEEAAQRVVDAMPDPSRRGVSVEPSRTDPRITM